MKYLETKIKKCFVYKKLTMEWAVRKEFRGCVMQTYGHKKRSNALLQPLLTLNLIL